MKKALAVFALFFTCYTCSHAQQLPAVQQQSALSALTLSQQIANSTYQPVFPQATATPAITIKKARLPFFCRQEVKLEEKTKLPLRFRAGSLEQANFLERKTDYVNKGF